MAKQLSLGALLRCGPVRRFQPIAVLHPPAQPLLAQTAKAKASSGGGISMGANISPAASPAQNLPTRHAIATRMSGCSRVQKKPAAALLKQAAALAETEVAPITDIRSSEVYRRLMVGVMLVRAARLAAARLAGRGPDYGLNILEEDAS